MPGTCGKPRKFTARQPGIAEEELPDDHPEVVAFRTRPEPETRDIGAELDALKETLDRAAATTDALVKKGVVTEQEIEAEKSGPARLV